MKKRKPQGKLDFLPNRNNKYSIRRFTVGTASILIGATLIFGAGEEAKAAENNDTQSSVKADDNQNSADSDSDESTVPQEQPTQDQAKQTETTDTSVNNDSQENDAQGSTQSESDATSQNNPETETSSNPKSDIQDSGESEESDVDSADNTDADAPQSTNNEQTSAQSGHVKSDDETQSEPQSSKESTQDTEADKQHTNKEETAPQSDNTESDGNDETQDGTNKQETEQAPKTDDETSTIHEPKSEAPTTSGESGSTQPESAEETSVGTSKDATQPESAKDTSVDTTKDLEEDSTTQSDFNDIKDSESAEAFYKQATGVSDEEAKEMVGDLGLSSDEYTPENVREALLKKFAAQQEAQPKATALRAADASDDALDKAVNEAVSEGSNDDKIIDADALANGYIDSNTDATNAPHTLSGRAWVADKGTPATMSNGLTAVPEGTEVYMQWLDRDGAQSPIYRAKTKNVQSSDGSQVGPGAYAFDLRDGWTDANGKTHKYGASPNQYYRLWIPDYTNEDGNTVTMLRQAGGFVPGTYINSATGDNIGQFPLAGTNMQRTGIFMMVKPNDGYMTKDKEDWIEYTGEKIGQTEAAFTTKKNLITGSVWQEVGRGTDLANSATGPNRDRVSGDKDLEGYRVVFSSLTKDGAKAYDEAMKGLEQSERASAAKTLLTEHPEYISATVTDTTDDKGRYTVQFPENTLDLSHVYGYVEDPDGNMVSSYSSFTSPEFRSANSNLSFTPQLAPVTRPINNSWQNVNFAVVEAPDIHMTIPDYNSTDKPVVAGDNVTVDLTGKVSPLPTHIEWKDQDGNVVKKTEDFTDLEDGESQAQFTIPDTAKDGDVYTAYLYEGNRIKDASSVVVKETDARKYDPDAEEITKDYGQPTTEDDIKNAITVPDYDNSNGDYTISVDEGAEIPDGTTPGTTNVPVTVTYPDGTSDHVEVPVTVGEQKDADKYDPISDGVSKPHGEAPTADEITNSVKFPDYPEDQDQPKVTVNNPDDIPDGNTSGKTTVPVTVKYPDESTEVVDVPVSIGEQFDNDKYEPAEPEEITKDYGQPTTEDDITGAVTIPGLSDEDKEGTTITVDKDAEIPDGTTPGTTNVPVTVTYPDGTTDHVDVPVTVGEQPDNDKYDATSEGVKKDYGQPTTEDDVKDSINIPGLSDEDKENTHITVDDPQQLPDGSEEGTTNVDVTVEYPDGTSDHVQVPVTVGAQDDNAKYEPEVKGITKDYGEPTTEDEITNSVTIPGLSDEDKEGTTITVDDPQQLPDGSEEGMSNVDVTVEYPDGTFDHVQVPVKVGAQKDADKYDPSSEGLTKDNGDAPTADEITKTVTIPGLSDEDKDGTTITVDEGADIPDGTTPGTTNVPVTVTYPDGTTDHVDVPVTINEPAEAPVKTPRISTVGAGDDKVSGTGGTPGNKVDVTIPGVKDPITATVGDDGTWSVDVPEDVHLNGGDIITAVESDDDGHTSDESTATVGEPNVTTPSINNVGAGDDKVSGTGGTPGNKVDVTIPGMKDPITTTVGDDGTWSVDVPEEVHLNGGDTISASERDDKGNVSKTTETTVGNPDVQAPTVAPVKEGETTVTGQNGTPGNTIEVTIPGVKDPITTTVNDDGTWSVEVPEGSLHEGDVIDATEVDSKGNHSTATPVTVGAPDTPDQTVEAPIVNPINDNSPAVDGKGTPGNTIVVTWPDGSHSSGTVNPDGSWEVEVPSNVDLQPGQNVSVVEKDQDGNTSTATTVPVNASDNGADNPGKTDKPGNTNNPGDSGNSGDQGQNTGATDDNQGSNGAQAGDQGQTITPAVNPIDSNDQSVTGQHGTPGNTVTATFPDGTTASTTVNADGTWSVPTPINTNLNNGDVVSVTEQDVNGNTSNVTQVTVGDNHIAQGSEQDANAEKELPDTGDSESNKGTIFGTIFAALGAIFLFGRRRKDNKDKQ